MGASAVLKPTDFNCIDKIIIIFFLSLLLCPTEHEGKSWQNFQFWMNYPFKGEVCNLYSNKQNWKYY